MLKFDKVYYQFHVPFAVYVNFESLLQKNDDQSDTNVPSGFCAVTCSILLYCYTGENVINEFIAHMHREECRIRSISSANESMIELTTEERVKHEYATACIS